MANIVLIVRRYIDGAAFTNRLLAYAKGLANAGNSVKLLFLITQDRHATCPLNHPSINVYHLWQDDGKMCRKHKILSYLRNLIRINKYIVSGDSIILFGFELPLSLRLSLLKKQINIFFEATEHPLYKGTSFYNKLRARIRLFFEKRSKGIFVISKSLKDYYIQNGIANNKISIINMFVDESRFIGLNKTNIDNDYIAYCGTISKHKDGVDDLIKAFSIFNKVHPNYRLYIIGKSETETEYNELIELVERLKLNNRVVFTGAISSNQMPQILYDAKILALARPSNLQTQNGFPTKLGEYLATGNPIAVTNIGDISCFIKDRVHGFVSEPDDIDAFANNLIYIASNYCEAIKIGKKGKELVQKEFSYIYQTSLVSTYINSFN